jgi:hypothetical protein
MAVAGMLRALAGPSPATPKKRKRAALEARPVSAKSPDFAILPETSDRSG